MTLEAANGAYTQLNILNCIPEQEQVLTHTHVCVCERAFLTFVCTFQWLGDECIHSFIHSASQPVTSHTCCVFFSFHSSSLPIRHEFLAFVHSCQSISDTFFLRLAFDRTLKNAHALRYTDTHTYASAYIHIAINICKNTQMCVHSYPLYMHVSIFA